jgi:hypothetical protein
MPVNQAKPATVTVATTATLLSSGGPYRKAVRIKNLGAATIFLGGPDVTTSGANKGWDLAAGAEFVDEYGSGPIYGIIAAATAEVRVWEYNG